MLVSVRYLLPAVPAVSAVSVGLLYCLGVVLTTTQLVGAHVSVTETLPMVPLQEHLTKGLGAVFSSLALGSIAVFGFVAMLVGYGWYRRYREGMRSLDESLSSAMTVVDDLTSDDLKSEAEAVNRERRRLAEQWAVLKAGEPSEEELTQMKAELDALDTRIQQFDVVIDAREVKNDEAARRVTAVEERLDAVKKDLGLLGRVNPGAFSVVMAPVLIVFGLLNPPAIAVGNFAVAVLFVFGRRLQLDAGTPMWMVAVAVLTMVPWIAEEYVNPVPLPDVKLVQRS